MAETPSSPPAGANSPAGGKKSSWLGRLSILAFIGGVVVSECLVAYLFLSARPETAAAVTESGKPPPSKEKEHEKGKKAKEAETEPPEQIEVDLGQFTVMAFQPASSTTLRIGLHLYGTVLSADGGEFSARLKETQHRFRDQVIVTLRGAEVSDLTDAGLGLLKRAILEKTNALVGKPLLKTVVFSDFSFVELQ